MTPSSMCRRKTFLAVSWLAAACFAATGCARLPRPDVEDMLAAAAVRSGLEREMLEASEKPRVNDEAKEAVLAFRVKGMIRPVVFAVRFTHHKYRGWEFHSLRDRYGDWVSPELFAEDVEAFRLSDMEYLLMLSAMTLSAYAGEHGRLPGEAEMLGPEVGAHYARYRNMYEKYFWFAPPDTMPVVDVWGNPLAYAMDVSDFSVLPLLFEVRSPGKDAKLGNQDDVFIRRDSKQVIGIYQHQLWFLR